MKKIILFAIIFILTIVGVQALDECKSSIFKTDSPCIILLPHNISVSPCNTINVTFFNESVAIGNKTMSNYTHFLCNAVFDFTGIGTYTFFYDTGDSGSITIKTDINAEYYLYVIVIIIFIFLMWMGYRLQESTPITIAGFLLGVVALNLYLNGFPNLNDDFLKNTYTIVLAGLSFFLMIAPNIEEIERLF